MKPPNLTEAQHARERFYRTSVGILCTAGSVVYVDKMNEANRGLWILITGERVRERALLTAGVYKGGAVKGRLLATLFLPNERFVYYYYFSFLFFCFLFCNRVGYTVFCVISFLPLSPSCMYFILIHQFVHLSIHSICVPVRVTVYLCLFWFVFQISLFRRYRMP